MTAAEARKGGSAFRWLIAALLLGATMINYADRVTLSVLIPDIRKALHLTENDYSQIVSMFLFSYAVMYAVSGLLVDRWGARRSLAIFAFAWSVAQMLHAWVRGKWSLAGCRFVLGLAEPGNFPAAVKAIREWFPVEQRALGVGIFNAGSSLGAALASPLAALVANHYGWRSAFVVTGIVGLVWLTFWLLLYPAHKAPPGGSERQCFEPAPGSGTDLSAWSRVLRSRPCLVLMLMRFLSDPVVYFVIFWLPAYLQKERGFDLAMIARYAWLPYVFGDGGYVLGGWFSGHLIDRGWKLGRARKTALAAGAFLLPAAIATPLVPSALGAVALMCLVVFGHSFWVANLLTLPADLFPDKSVGTVSGLSGMSGSFGGVLASLAIGAIISRFSYRYIFLVAGLMHLVSLVIALSFLPESCFAETTAER